MHNIRLRELLHDVCFVYSSNAVAVVTLRVVEGVSCNTFGSLPCNKFDGLHYTIYYLVLDSRIFSLRIFTNEYSIDIIICSSEPRDGKTWPDIGEEVERSS